MTLRLLFVSLLCCAGCGAAADPARSFVGTWSFASGTDNVSCPNGTTAVSLTGNLTVKPGSDGGLTVLDAAGCNFAYTLAGADATLTGDKSCTFPVPELGQDVTADAAYDTITLSTTDAKTMGDTFSGKVTYTSPSGALDCVFSGSASLQKISDS